jgi:hypothetical protein
MTTKGPDGEAGATESAPEATGSIPAAAAAPPKPKGPPAGASVAAGEWPELDQLVETVKTRRAEEITRQEEQRNAAQRATKEAQKAWATIEAHRNLEEMATRLTTLGVLAKQAEAVAGSHSAALELSRLPKGEAATIRIDTTPSRNGPPRTTVQVQRGNQQLQPVTLNVNSASELRRTLVDIAQKLLA